VSGNDEGEKGKPRKREKPLGIGMGSVATVTNVAHPSAVL
jgi:hypothetical protein